MEVCYQCGKIIKETINEKAALTCDRCDVQYCLNCAYDVDTCYHCGAYVDNNLSSIQHSFVSEDIYPDPRHVKRRKHLRKELRFPMDYYFTSERDTDEQNVFRAITKNISASGVSIYTLTDLAEGQEVKIPLNFRLGNHTSAIVRWVKKESDNLYSVGMSFT